VPCTMEAGAEQIYLGLSCLFSITIPPMLVGDQNITYGPLYDNDWYNDWCGKADG
jgi:hypothetical protein